MLFGSNDGTGFLGCWRSGIRSFEAPPGKRWMLGYFMIDLSKSTSAGENSAAAQPLSSPAYFPGEVVEHAIRRGPIEDHVVFLVGIHGEVVDAPESNPGLSSVPARSPLPSK